jgi:EAL domain-containing protein (putative c-di-GMP-specific phosphodiesterase class I)
VVVRDEDREGFGPTLSDAPVEISSDALALLERSVDRARFDGHATAIIVVAIHPGSPSARAQQSFPAEQLVTELVRPNDRVIPLRDEELAIVATFDDDPATAYEAALALGRRLRISTATLGFTTTVGGVLCHAGTQESTIVSLSRARVLAITGMAQSTGVRIAVAADVNISTPAALHEALDKKELRLHYQPVVGLSDGIRCGFEALLRWERPGYGLLAPAAFLDAAVDSDLMGPIGSWAVHQATHDLADLTQRGIVREGEYVGVNVATSQLRSSGFARDVADALHGSAIDPNRLMLEITEQALLSDDDQTAATLRSLSHLGTPIAIDDFGTGYSSLSLLRRLHADVLKIDREFITLLGSGTETRDEAIVSAIVTLARDLGMKTVAEGIDSEQQQRWLQRHGCDLGQGWRFGLPLAIHMIS